ncbi:MAG: diacylglycerol kinase family protein [Candidatus Taylorbacteria bacterium]|nr:diacylglycerol kinase family protein [Candidatus Taylorbacteria bacterium]
MENKRFSLVARLKSFTHAGRGLWIFVKTTHNAWVQTIVLLLAIFFGLFFDITRMEWIILIVTSGIVLSAEAFNTAIEIDMDLTSPEYHPYVKDTKDVAAAAVLITAIVAVVVGVLIFYPYITDYSRQG